MAMIEDFTTIAFLEYFSEIEDPRIERQKLYSFDEIFLTTLCAKICGAESWEDMEDFGEAKIGFLKQYLPYKNGTPSHDTFARVFSLIDPKQFKECFNLWTKELQSQMTDVISIDGKTLRGNFDKQAHQSAIHMVSAFASNARLILGQEKVDEKSNEITAIPKLLEVLFLKGAIITIDAMGCQREIAKKIIEKGADYILALKGNQRDLYDDTCLFFKDKDNKELLFDESFDKGHGRIEIRRCFACKEIDWLTKKEDWVELKSLVLVESERIIGDKKPQKAGIIFPV